MMNDSQRTALGNLWDAEHVREALIAFFEDEARGLVGHLRAAVIANDIVKAATFEGQLQALEQLPKSLERQGVTRTGNG